MNPARVCGFLLPGTTGYTKGSGSNVLMRRDDLMPPWYYSQKGQPTGPVEEDQLREMLRGGQLDPNELVWREGMPQWIPARQANLVTGPPPLPAASPSQRAISACRTAIGGPPRQMLEPPMAPPPWMHKVPSDALWEIYRRQEWVYTQGIVVWGHIVQANSQLFSPGQTDCPASVLYSTDLWFDGQPEALGAIAEQLFAVKGKRHPDPGMAEFSRMLANEVDRAPRLPVPPALTGGRPVFHTSVMVVRGHLPRGYLTHSLFPLLIEPRHTFAAIILPSRFWPPELLRLWDPDAS